MPNELLIKHIAQALQKGEQKEIIKRALINKGLKEKEIEAALEAAGRMAPPAPPAPPPPPSPPQAQPASPVQPKTSWDTIPQPRKEPIRKEAEQVTQQTPKLPVPKKSFLPALIIILLLIGVGAGAAYYFLKDSLDFFGSKEEPEAQVDEFTPSPPISHEEPEETTESEPEPEPEIVLSDDEKKLIEIDQAKVDVTNHYEQYGIYPSLVEMGHEDVFYCYRKNGQHYILGTVLEADHSALVNDLDGSYYCGAEVKDCADPVYCVGP